MTWLKNNWLALILVVAAGIFIYFQGKANGELKAKLFVLQETQDSLLRSIKAKDTVIVHLTDTVRISRTKIVTVDKKTKPAIDSALAVLNKQLDSTGRAKLSELKTSYEAQVVARDNTINDMQRLIDLQHGVIVERDKLIASKDQEIKLLKGHGLVKTIGIVTVGVLAFIAGRII